MKNHVLSILVLLAAVATGAWAQTETLLTTITATAKEQASYSTANVATVSFSYTAKGSSVYNANWGWWGYGWSATVTAAEGYTITKCIFYDDANRTATDSEAPFVVETTEEDKTPKVNGTPILAYTSKGIKKIEVYGYVTPTTVDVTLADGTDDATSWQGKAGEGEYQALPLTGLEAGTAVTVKYNGTKKVKSVKAVKKTEGKVVDLSTYSGTSYEVIEDVTFTGTTNNEISILYKGEGYEVTLDNVNAPASFIAAWDDNYTVNVKLKGTSRLKGIYDQNADVNIGEAEAGGTVILVDESSPLGGSGTTITINGGTVKAKTSSFSALYNALEVNSGAVYLEAAEGYGAVDGSASGSVTLYGWDGSAWVTYSDHRYLSTDNSKAPSEWTW